MKYYLLLSLLFAFCPAQRQTEKPTVIQKPIVFDDERRALSLAYMKEHYGLTPDEPVFDPKMIVVHWTAIPTFQESFDAFYPARLPGNRKDIKRASALNVSVPYLIDRDGQIYQLMPDTVFARHVIGLNQVAIGIENVGDGQGHPLTDAQLEANIKLIRYLVQKYDIKYVIGHHEYQQFIGHPLWIEKDPNYLTEKDDPGDAFMNKIRNRLSVPLNPLPKAKR